MADKKISQLTALAASSVAPSTDVLAIVDSSATETKKITAKDVVDGALNAGTANGVLYLNGSKEATSGSAFVFDGTNVGIGTSSPVDELHINTTGSNVNLRLTRDTDTGARISASNGAGVPIIKFDTIASGTATERMVITSAGLVGIGTSSPATILSLGSVNELLFDISAGAFPSATYDSSAFIARTGSGGSAPFDQAGSLVYRTRVSSTAGRSSHIFYTGSPSVERLRINEAGNVGIGTSSPGAKIEATASGAVVQILNRTTSDGGILQFEKDGSTVGSIGTASSYLTIGSPVGSGGYLLIGNNLVHPATSTGGAKDNAIDIGGSSNRFKDLYLSGGVYLGGTGASNQLDDYEEGTWTPTFAGSTTNPTVTYVSQNGTYVRIGRQVTVWFQLGTSANTGGAGDIRISGLPFTQSADTRAYPSISTYNVDNPLANPLGFFAEGVQNQSYVLVLATADNTTWQSVTWANATAASVYMQATMTYTV